MDFERSTKKGPFRSAWGRNTEGGDATHPPLSNSASDSGIESKSREKLLCSRLTITCLEMFVAEIHIMSCGLTILKNNYK